MSANFVTATKQQKLIWNYGKVTYRHGNGKLLKWKNWATILKRPPFKGEKFSSMQSWNSYLHNFFLFTIVSSTELGTAPKHLFINMMGKFARSVLHVCHKSSSTNMISNMHNIRKKVTPWHNYLKHFLIWCILWEFFTLCLLTEGQ